MNQLVYIESCARKIQKQKLAKEKKDSENQNLDCNDTVSAATQKVQSMFLSYFHAVLDCFNYQS